MRREETRAVMTRRAHGRRSRGNRDRPAGAAARGSAPVDRAGPVQRRPQPAGAGLCGDGALAARARADPRRSIPRRRARAPGVLAVLTAEDVRADGLNPLPNIANTHPADISIKNKDGSPTIRPEQAAIIGPEVCHVGEIVAAVVATSARRRQGRRRTRRGRLRGVAGGRAQPRRRRARARRAARQEQPQRHPRRRGRRPGRDRGGLCRGGACRPVRDLGAAHRRRADGAARRDRRIRRRRPAATRCTPAPAARSARGAIWRSCSASRPSRRAS